MSEQPIWDWFGLTYSSYLVLPRSLLCGMPVEWQARMVALLDEMRATYDPEQINDRYTVLTKDASNRFVRDPWRDYRHPPPLPYRAQERAA